MIFQHQDFANFLWNLYKFVKICFFFYEIHLFPYAQVHLNTFLICACASLFYLFRFACARSHRDKDIVRLVPSRLKPGNKSTRSVLPFKLRCRSLSWNRTIVSHFGLFVGKNVKRAHAKTAWVCCVMLQFPHAVSVRKLPVCYTGIL